MFNKKVDIKGFISSKEFEAFTSHQDDLIKDILLNEFYKAIENPNKEGICEVNMDSLEGILSFMTYREVFLEKLTK